MRESNEQKYTIDDSCGGLRYDQALARSVPDFSRSQLKKMLLDGQLSIDGKQPGPRDKAMGGELVIIQMPENVVDQHEADATVELHVLYEDEHIAVFNKQAEMVMHPAAGNPTGTVLNGLLHRYPDAANLPRAGIVHRLDKDTTGLFVVARSDLAHRSLVDQLQERTVSREYDAVAWGTPVAGATIDAPIGRHGVDRKRMAVRPGGREAITHYRVEERFISHSWLRVKLETGRTHQIRVHLSEQKMPLVGDTVYGGRLRIPKGASDELQKTLREFPRQALHARRLSLIHPATGETCSWESPLPDDMQALLAALRQHTCDA
ncbi:MAG: 23S rRNA pseudouridine(1911/1915/1917) synthase RluD [Granulosicoccaceae bacterium]